ncbi:MAG: hypothetical protein FWD16_02595 [Clostridia bacterium]|nr:hypothetical protein [Clostridia bacterium]
MILNIIFAAVTGAALTALVAVLLVRRKPQKKKKSQQTPLEFSKRIFIGLAVQVGAIAVYVCAVAWRTEDMSVTQALIDNAFDLLKVGVVSYFGKAALENRIKLAHLFPKLKNQIFNDRGGEP